MVLSLSAGMASLYFVLPTPSILMIILHLDLFSISTILSLLLGSLSKREFRIFTVLFLCSIGFTDISISNSASSGFTYPEDAPPAEVAGAEVPALPYDFVT